MEAKMIYRDRDFKSRVKLALKRSDGHYATIILGFLGEDGFFEPLHRVETMSMSTTMADWSKYESLMNDPDVTDKISHQSVKIIFERGWNE